MTDIWAFCNRKGGNCREKPILHLYAQYDSWAEICPEIVLTQKKNFPAVCPLFIAKGPYNRNRSSGTSTKTAVLNFFPVFLRAVSIYFSKSDVHTSGVVSRTEDSLLASF